MILLTGATGLLGRYLLRDLLASGEPVVTIARGQRRESPADRIETILQRWERQSGKSFIRPIVLEGELNRSGLGLTAEDRHWVSRHCSRIIHSAASLRFDHDPATNEPYTSNVQGTENVLAFCAETGIREFHHVSTAYVAGLRTGRVLETERDVGQKWGNIYEETKCRAEKMVQQHSALSDVTIYRPSIIVGDSDTGYTSTYHGFYTPLRLLHVILTKLPIANSPYIDFLGLLGLNGDEQKNLVPVNWVSAAIVQLHANRKAHGRTYHLTSPQPVTVNALRDAFWAELQPLLGRNTTNSTALGDSQMPGAQEIQASFHDPMRVYEAYWRNDPVFDRTQLDAALPNLPCPVLDHATLLSLTRFAISDNFGWPFERPIAADTRLAGHFKQLASQASRNELTSNSPPQFLGLEVTGVGGGTWRVKVDQGTTTGVELGLVGDEVVSLRLSAENLAGLLAGRLTPMGLVRAGKIVVSGSQDIDAAGLEDWMDALTLQPQQWSEQGRLAVETSKPITHSP